jgi:hypothetical protein
MGAKCPVYKSINLSLKCQGHSLSPLTGDKGQFTQWVYVDYIEVTGIK